MPVPKYWAQGKTDVWVQSKAPNLVTFKINQKKILRQKRDRDVVLTGKKSEG